MATLTAGSGLSLPCLVLLLLLGIPGAGAQEFQLLQPQGAVSVSAGETLTLLCSVTGNPPAGPTKWFKGSGPTRQLVYEEKGSFPRVTRVTNTDTDYSIRINDTRPEDAGTYRCVMFKKGLGGDEEIGSGAGTNVSVSARPSAPSVSGPPSRAEPGTPVNFTCTSGGFSPRDITVTWLKNGVPLPAPQTRVLPEHENVSYNVSSTVGLNLSAGDARSQLTCQIEHSALAAPLRGTYNLSHALRGQSLLSSPALWIGLVLEKMLTGAFLLFLFLRAPGLFPDVLARSPPATCSVCSLCPQPGDQPPDGGAAAPPAGLSHGAQA
ncbi:signal-regulatory protein beta-1-like isoform X3 [Pelodiscus sinensis]|uniref:signal-regulatory protein beta-1-like isoform X3 n=1 Tax=Pelodiscus sinensis TaxID=13735 RepID=UPI003F6C89D0